MHWRTFSLALLACIYIPAGAQSLAELESKAKGQPAAFDQILTQERTLHEGVDRLIQSDALKSAEDFRRAGLLQLGANERREAILATGYQLLLTAVSMGDEVAAAKLGTAWDGLLMATGRYRRIGAVKMPMMAEPGESWWVDPAPATILAVYVDPAAAKRAAMDSKDNSEVQQIVDADQKVRQDFSKLTPDQLRQMAKDDRGRFHRIKEIIAAGGLKTAQDFWNAALVCQHGEVFLDYALAHELSICALILGKKEASWLAGASYDRMLLSASYPQAFDTQYTGNWHMREFTKEGVNDRMRKAVVHLTLTESQDREKHPPKF